MTEPHDPPTMDAVQLPARLGPPIGTASEVELDGRISVYAPAVGEVLSLNDTASDIWRLCDGMRSLDEIVSALADAYRVSTEAIYDEVEAVLRRFLLAGLLPTDGNNSRAEH